MKTFMQRHAPPAALLAIASVVALGCQHTHVYRPEDMPPADSGYLLVPQEHGGEPEPFEIESVRVARDAHPDVFASPTAEELRALASGEDTETLEAVEIKVDTGSKVWKDYAVVGVGIAALLGAGVGFLVSGIDGGGENRLDLSERMAISGLMAAGFSVYGVGIGSLVGVVATGGRTDHRLDP